MGLPWNETPTDQDCPLGVSALQISEIGCLLDYVAAALLFNTFCVRGELSCNEICIKLVQSSSDLNYFIEVVHLHIIIAIRHKYL